MKDHTKGGVSGLIFRLTALGFAVAGLFHFFTFVLLRTPSAPAPKKQQVQTTDFPEESQESKNLKERLLKPTKPVIEYTPVFRPKELIEVTGKTGATEGKE